MGGTGLGLNQDLPRADHLNYNYDNDHNIWLAVRSDILFLDIKRAYEDSGVSGMGLELKHLTEGGRKTFLFTSELLVNSLVEGKHKQKF